MRGWVILGALGTVAGAAAFWVLRPVGAPPELALPATPSQPAAPVTAALEPAALPQPDAPKLPLPAPNPLPPLYRACLRAAPAEAPGAYRRLMEADALPPQWAELAAEMRDSLVPSALSGPRAELQIRILQGIDRSVPTRHFMLQVAREAPDPEVRLLGIRFLDYWPPLRSAGPPPPGMVTDLQRADLRRLAFGEPDPKLLAEIVDAWMTYPEEQIPARFWVEVASPSAKPVHRLLAARALDLDEEWERNLLMKILGGTAMDPVSILARERAAATLQHAFITTRRPRETEFAIAPATHEAVEALLGALRSDAAEAVREQAVHSLDRVLANDDALREHYRRAIQDAAAVDPAPAVRTLAVKLFGE